MGRIGSSYDHAAAESFFATLKRELDDTWATAEQARLAVFAWIGFYNQRRRHSTLGYRSPVDYAVLVSGEPVHRRRLPVPSRG